MLRILYPFVASPRLRSALACAALAAVAAGAGGERPARGGASAAPAGAGDAAEARRPLRLEGQVLLPDGRPARGAVVVSSAGGSAAVRADGTFALATAVEPAAEALALTATVRVPGGALTAHRRLDGLQAGPPTRDAGVFILALAGGCAADWIPTFGGQPGANDEVEALVVFDDGSGPALYAAGKLVSAGGQTAAHVARWDGEGWSPLGSGTDQEVLALAVFDDGAGEGPALYAAGWFDSAGDLSATRIARWDGAAWSPVGSGLGTAAFEGVNALAVFDDGAGGGPALYAGGSFTTAGGQGANRMARWDGAAWSEVGGGMNFTVYSLAVYDDGSGAGAALYAGGAFSIAGGQSANRIARWDGQAWSPLGTGMNESVDALAVIADGTSGAPALYAGGHFTNAGSLPANRIARWDGQAWSALGSGMNASVSAVAAYDDGSGAGPALYAGGAFSNAGGQSASFVARWDGAAWSPLATGMNAPVSALAVHDDGSGAGPALYAGGEFTLSGGQGADRIAAWDGEAWSTLGNGLNQAVETLVVFDDGAAAGPALYAGGQFTSAGGQSAKRIARWRAGGWSPLAGGVNLPVQALAVFDDGLGAGPALYAGGQFTQAGGQPASRIARWDGAAWSALGSGLNNTVYALAVYDDGSGAGPALYAAGAFTSAGGVTAGRIAKWDGAGWSALGSGINGTVYALAVYDDGSGAGPVLCAGGTFAGAGGQPANFIAQWDGLAWSTLDTGMNFTVRALAAFDDGAGPALYAGGQFTSAGAVTANRIARWDGQGWTALAGGLNDDVLALAVFDEGSGNGPALYAGGELTLADGLSANHAARWDGGAWSALGGGLGQPVHTLIGFDDGSGHEPALYAGGLFDVSPAGDSYLARWRCPPVAELPGCYGNPGTLTALSSTAKVGSAFAVSLSAESFTAGLALLYFGFDGTDAGGCGLPVPNLGELLLSISSGPYPVGSAHLIAGSVGFSLPVPGVSSLVGVEVAFQGVLVGVFQPEVPIEFTNGVLVKITQ